MISEQGSGEKTERVRKDNSLNRLVHDKAELVRLKSVPNVDEEITALPENPPRLGITGDLV